MRTSLYFVLAAVPLALGGCDSLTDAGGPGIQASAFSATAAPAPAAAVAMPVASTQREYRLTPGDVIIVSVFQVADLNKEVELDASGQISFPLIGQVRAGGRTAHELETDIAAKLRARYLQSPQVSVFLKRASGQQITMDGSVKLPGVYATESNMTLLRALARAGGLAETGDPANVAVFHVENGQRTAAKYNVDDIRAGKALDPQLYGGDTVVVDSSSTREVWKNFKEVAPALGGVATLARPL